MKHAIRFLATGLMLLAAAGILPGNQQSSLEFTVSMEQPHRHYYHVQMRCRGLEADAVDFKLPAWTPGYYLIMDYARNVLNFSVESGGGTSLSWDKTAKNTWRVERGGADVLVVSYDVYAFTRSVADSFLDDRRAFICPTGVFMHAEGMLAHPVTVTFIPSRKDRTYSRCVAAITTSHRPIRASDIQPIWTADMSPKAKGRSSIAATPLAPLWTNTSM